MTYRQLVVLFFVSNGLGSVGLQALGMLPGGAVPTGLVFLYLAGSAAAGLTLARNPRVPDRKSLFVGAVAGLASAAGLAGVCLAVSLVPGHILFPVSSIGALSLVALFGCIGFKEKIGPYGIAGIVVGALALLLLSS